MIKVKETIYSILKGSFLVNENSFRNWQFILFVVLLMLVMIGSSHSSDKKVMQIAKLNKEIKELRAEFVDTRSIVMRMKLESTIKRNVEELGLKPSETPPQVVKVVSNKTKQ